MNIRLLLLALVALVQSTYAQTITEIGSMPYNANFNIKYKQDMILTCIARGLELIDVSDLSNPQKKASVNFPFDNFIIAPALDGNYIYVGSASQHKFIIADISDLSAPKQLGFTTGFSGSPKQIEIVGNYAFVTTDSDTFYTIDISDKLKPTVAGRLNLGSKAEGIAINGKYAYVASYSGLHVIDISTPSKVKIINTLTAFYQNLAPDFANNRLFATNYGGFHYIDIKNPSTPIALFATGGSANSAEISRCIGYWNNIVFLTSNKSVAAFALTSTGPEFITEYIATSTSPSISLTVRDSVFFVSTHENIHILKIGGVKVGVSAPTEPKFSIYPNPVYHQLTVETESEYKGNIDILDALGRTIKTMKVIDTSTTIDLSNLNAGTYFIRLQKNNLPVYKLFVKE